MLLLLLLLLPVVAVGGYDGLSIHSLLLLLPLAGRAQLPRLPPPPPQTLIPQHTPRAQSAIRESSAGTGSAWNRKIEPLPLTSSPRRFSWPTFGDGWSVVQGGVVVVLAGGYSGE